MFKANGSTAQKVAGLLLTMSIASTAYGDNSISTQSDLDSCRNSQIISYAPASGSNLENLDYIEYWVKEETKIASLQASINGESQAVQYKEFDDGTYRARVLVDDELEGSMYVDLGAGSEESGSCNDLLSISFVIDKDDSYDPYGVPQTQTLSTDHHSHRSHARLDASQPQYATVVLEDQQEIGSTDSENSEDESEEAGLADRGEGTNNLLQTATLIGGLAGIGGLLDSNCNTLGGSWSWYVWLGFLWVYLVALWLVVGYTVEPIFGQERYARRLGWTIGIGTVAAMSFWWMANPCYTHLWVPISLSLLGVALYWLYSEDTPVEHSHLNQQNQQQTS